MPSLPDAYITLTIEVETENFEDICRHVEHVFGRECASVMQEKDRD